MSWTPSFRSVETVTGLPLTRQLFFPSAKISREMPSSGSYGIWFSANHGSSGTPEKIALTNAFCSPVRIISREARSPKMAEIASMTMDFPAPVSPVRTLKPLSKAISACSITAIFSICRVESIGLPPVPFWPQCSICSRISAQSSAAACVSFSTTKHVSSPASVPSISGMFSLSIAEAAPFASPGMVLTTIMFCA